MSKTVELKDRLLEQGFTAFPPIEIEAAYESLENPPNFEKYMKPIRKTAAQFDTLWKMNLSIIHKFRDCDFLYRTCFTDRTFYYLVDVYAEIDLDIKEFNKSLKQCDPIVKEYYAKTQFNDFFAMNIFDLMKDDFEEYRAIAERRHEEYHVAYPNNIDVLADGVTDYLAEYKNALKQIKSKRSPASKK